LAAGLCSDSLGSLQRSPVPLAVFKGYRKGQENLRRGGERQGKETGGMGQGRNGRGGESECRKGGKAERGWEISPPYGHF